MYYTDETWAREGSGFYKGEIKDLGQVAMGICKSSRPFTTEARFPLTADKAWISSMALLFGSSQDRTDTCDSPYKFEAPWNAFEFAFHVLKVKANLVVLSMAWLTQRHASVFCHLPQKPDMETLTYWVQRLEPVIRADQDGEIIVVLANRCGTEDDAVYAGTSTVLGIKNGEVSVYGLLGRGTEELLIVNTDEPPFAKLLNRSDQTEQPEKEPVAGEPASESAAPTGPPVQEAAASPRT